jgi:hypothetical protein
MYGASYIFWKGKEQFPGSHVPLLRSSLRHLGPQLQPAEHVRVGNKLTGTVQMKTAYKTVVVKREWKGLLRRSGSGWERSILKIAVLHNS